MVHKYTSRQNIYTHKVIFTIPQGICFVNDAGHMYFVQKLYMGVKWHGYVFFLFTKSNGKIQPLYFYVFQAETKILPVQNPHKGSWKRKKKK